MSAANLTLYILGLLCSIAVGILVFRYHARPPESRVLTTEDFDRFSVMRGERRVYIDLSKALMERDPDLKVDVETVVQVAPEPWPEEVIVYGEGTTIYLPYRVSSVPLEDLVTRVEEYQEMEEEAEKPSEPIFKSGIAVPDWWFDEVVPEAMRLEGRGVGLRHRIKNLAFLFYQELLRDRSVTKPTLSKDEFVAAVLGALTND
jgi:hypothetical protein